MIPNLHKNVTERNASMHDLNETSYMMFYLILIGYLIIALWILAFLTVTGILKWECCNDCITRLRQRIRSNMTDTTGNPDTAMVTMTFQITPASLNQSTVDSTTVPPNTIASRSEIMSRTEDVFL